MLAMPSVLSPELRLCQVEQKCALVILWGFDQLYWLLRDRTRTPSFWMRYGLGYRRKWA